MSPRLVGDGLMLVGDAARQASPIVGEGIRFAMLAGLLAGRVAARAVRRGDASRQGLLGFERLWRRQFETRMRWAQWINERIARYSDDMWDRRMAIIGRFTPAQFAALLRTDLSAGWLLGAMATNGAARRYAVERVAQAVRQRAGR
ncbi:MAG: hypothetical protein HY660_07710 [Armatimonadetes bacterium]|nr:hypothetical protein [Armatimonadota bacterium]